MLRFFLFACLCAILPAWAGEAPAKGRLVVVGGGKTDDAVLKRALEMAGGVQAPIVILPQASEVTDAGEKSADL